MRTLPIYLPFFLGTVMSSKSGPQASRTLPFPQPPSDEMSMRSPRLSVGLAPRTPPRFLVIPTTTVLRPRSSSPSGAFAFVAAFSPSTSAFHVRVRLPACACLPALDVHICLAPLRIRILDHTPRGRILLLHLGPVPLRSPPRRL
ncbi:hypothetical protein C8J57DRAFT_207475 [Mycena rebaudengoi]|nr:hypothetical protein C8J57DRAFT_207475 [Mycena rebaudengoi]